MATSTYTCSIFKGNSEKVVYKGDQSISGAIVYSGTIGDTLYLAKVPNGATIVDFYEYHTSGQTAASISFGFDRGVAAGGGGNASCLISGSGSGAGSGTLGATNRFNVANWPVGSNWPPTLSLTSTSPSPTYAILTAKSEAGTFTISVSIFFTLIYRMDGPQPRPPGMQEVVP
jgi:hypothetical protein